MVTFLNLQAGGKYPTQPVYPLQNNSDKYGKIDASNFRVSNVFNLASFAEDQRLAYALEGSYVLYQNQTGNATLLNAILKPVEPVSIQGVIVKYFIYRGLLKSSIINSSNDDIVTEAYYTGKNIKANQTIIHAIRNGNEGAFNTHMLGVDWAYSGSTLIDEVFRSKESLAGNQYELFKAGTGAVIGIFADAGIGLDIVVESNNTHVDLDMARLGVNIINVPSGSSVSETRVVKERILSYMDLAPFSNSYPVVWSTLENILINVNGSSTGALAFLPITGPNYNSKISNQLASRHKIYLDIRNEQGYSLDFFGDNHTLTGENFKIAVNDTELTNAVSANYYDSGWPVYTFELPPSAIIGSDDYEFPIALSFVKNFNPLPLVFAEGGALNSKGEYLEDIECFQTDDSNDSVLAPLPPLFPLIDWSQPFIYYFPVRDAESSSYFSILYVNRRKVPDSNPTNSLKRDHYLDNLFGPLLPYDSFKRFATAKTTQWTRYGSKRYLRFNGIDMMVDIGVAMDDSFIDFYAIPTAYYQKIVQIPFLGSSVVGGVSNSGTASTQFIDKDSKPIKITLQEQGSGTKVALVNRQGNDYHFVVRFNVSLSRTEYDQLHNIAAQSIYSQDYPSYINFYTTQKIEDADAINIPVAGINIKHGLYYYQSQIHVAAFKIQEDQWDFSPNSIPTTYLRSIDLFNYSSNNAAINIGQTLPQEELQDAYIPVDELLSYLSLFELLYANSGMDTSYITFATRLRVHYYGNKVYYRLSLMNSVESNLTGGVFEKPTIRNAKYKENDNKFDRYIRLVDLHLLAPDNLDFIDLAFRKLTSHANENTLGDNPSPYLLIDAPHQAGSKEFVDLGHTLFAFEAMYYSHQANSNYDPTNPTGYTGGSITSFYKGKASNRGNTGIGQGFPKFNIYHMYDLCGLLGDIGAAAGEYFYHMYTGNMPAEQAYYPDTPILERYFNITSPNADLLSDVDGVCLWLVSRSLAAGTGATPNRILFTDLMGYYYKGALRAGITANTVPGYPPVRVENRWLLYCLFFGFVRHSGTYDWLPVPSTNNNPSNEWKVIRDAWRTRMFFFAQFWCGQIGDKIHKITEIYPRIIQDFYGDIYAFRDWFKPWADEDVAHTYNESNYPNPIGDQFNFNDPSSANYSSYRTKIKGIVAQVFEDEFLNNFVRQHLSVEADANGIAINNL